MVHSLSNITIQPIRIQMNASEELFISCHSPFFKANQIKNSVLNTHLELRIYALLIFWINYFWRSHLINIHKKNRTRETSADNQNVQIIKVHITEVWLYTYIAGNVVVMSVRLFAMDSTLYVADGYTVSLSFNLQCNKQHNE